MAWYQIALLIAAVAYAVYRQSQRHEVVGDGRFKLAIIYGVVGFAVGGFSRPDNVTEVLLLVSSLLLSVLVGTLRGRYTRVWAEDGRVFSQGTKLTIALFLLMVLAKFALGTVAYFTHVSDDGGFGEVLLMIGVMVAFQAELIWRRGRALGAPARSADPVASRS